MAILVLGFISASKKLDCDMKKNAAKNAYSFLTYLFDIKYTINGEIENNNTYKNLNKNSGFIFIIF